MRTDSRVMYPVLLWGWLAVATMATFAALAYALSHAELLV